MKKFLIHDCQEYIIMKRRIIPIGIAIISIIIGIIII